MTARLRTVFFGSSEFSIPSLRGLMAEQDVVAVCTQPDRPAGRGLVLTATPVATVARQADIEVLSPWRWNAAEIAKVAERRPALLAVASYGKLLPQALLSIPGATALNVHPSMLPAYRGATPIQAALRDGCRQTGVTVFWMSAGMDDGDIALAQTVEIGAEENYGTLHDRLAVVGAELLAQAARQLAEGTLPRRPQRHESATYTKPLSKDDLRLKLDAEARKVVDQIRSLSPKPGAWMQFEGKRLKVLEAQALAAHSDGHEGGEIHLRNAAPGTLIGWMPEGPAIATDPGAIVLTSVVPEGKAVMSGVDFANRSRANR